MSFTSAAVKKQLIRKKEQHTHKNNTRMDTIQDSLITLPILLVPTTKVAGFSYNVHNIIVKVVRRIHKHKHTNKATEI